MGKVVYQRKREGKAIRTGCGEIGCIKTHDAMISARASGLNYILSSTGRK